eukprot:3494165-Pyramimonas_sp.AAC.1
MGGLVTEAMEAVVTIDHYATSPGLEGPPAEQGEIRLRPEEKRRTQPYAAASTAIVNIFFGGEPYGATNRVGG